MHTELARAVWKSRHGCLDQHPCSVPSAASAAGSKNEQRACSGSTPRGACPHLWRQVYAVLAGGPCIGTLPLPHADMGVDICAGGGDRHLVRRPRPNAQPAVLPSHKHVSTCHEGRRVQLHIHAVCVIHGFMRLDAKASRVSTHAGVVTVTARACSESSQQLGSWIPTSEARHRAWRRLRQRRHGCLLPLPLPLPFLAAAAAARPPTPAGRPGGEKSSGIHSFPPHPGAARSCRPAPRLCVAIALGIQQTCTWAGRFEQHDLLCRRARLLLLRAAQMCRRGLCACDENDIVTGATRNTHCMNPLRRRTQLAAPPAARCQRR